MLARIQHAKESVLSLKTKSNGKVVEQILNLLDSLASEEDIADKLNNTTTNTVSNLLDEIDHENDPTQSLKPPATIDEFKSYPVQFYFVSHANM